MTCRYWEIEIDGPDKTGKDLLCKYLCELSHYRFSINVRGLVSQLVYTHKYNRDFTYDIRDFSKKKILIVLTGDTEDLEVRCKITGEQAYDIDGDKQLFDLVTERLKSFYRVYTFNTSLFTPYKIAKIVIARINKLEAETDGKIL